MTFDYLQPFVRPLDSIAAHTPLRTGGRCLAWIEIYSCEQLGNLLDVLKKKDIRWKIHWPFQDWLVADEGFNGVIIRLGGFFAETALVDEGISLGSSALFSSLKKIEPWGSFFEGWSGTPGGLWDSQQHILLQGCSLEIHWIKKRKTGTLVVLPGDLPPTLPPNSILSKVIVKESTKRKRSKKPKQNGQIFFDKKSGRCAGDLLDAHQLGGTRLRNWAISQNPPGRIIHFTRLKRTPNKQHQLSDLKTNLVLPAKESTESSDLLELGKAIGQRIKRRSQREVMINLPRVRPRKVKKNTRR
ncbi:MAG: hypothetical protein CMK59_08215 [Proteobacteria bacterium]|nr:hypothetical protein [Pseudomonadota bacterium]